MPLKWLDLHCEGDPHPRRFDRRELALAYLRRVERLDEAAVAELDQTGAVAPPLARRAYRLTPAGAALD